jgi:hypothetical protein
MNFCLAIVTVQFQPDQGKPFMELNYFMQGGKSEVSLSILNCWRV